MSEQRRFAFDADEADARQRDPAVERDRAARLLATDPLRNVALEASAGTGKTRVLVDRYVRLVVEADVPPRHILAITFTRKAAAEMRQRVLATLETRRREGAITDERWRRIRDAFPEITISTIDAFCLSLLREFPLEAGVDPGFDLADETETPRLVARSLDRALRVGRALAREDPDVALLFADLGESRLRQGLAILLDRRLVAWDALNRFLRGSTVHVADACDRLHATLRGALHQLPGGASAFIARGPDMPGFVWLTHEVRALASAEPLPPERLRGALDRLTAYVLTDKGEPRQRMVYKKAEFRSAADYEAHKAHVFALGPAVVEAAAAFRRDLNLVLARGVRRLFSVAQDQYRRTLDAHGVLDFSDVLERTLALLEQRDEFSRSRFKLESRYRHLLVDEFQDTSRAQWRLVRELMSAWAEGAGPAETAIPPSIFIVGDRKQSIYAFRDAEVAVLDAAGRYIDALRPDAPARAAITRSHRSVLALLRFVNDVFDAIDKQPERADAFRYSDDDRFPLATDAGPGVEAVNIVTAQDDGEHAERAADEIARLLLDGVVVRDRFTGVPRPVAPGDIAVLFRTRDGHRLFEQALGRRRVPFYVYKGLGFFDADEIKDVLALIAYLADPGSHLRAAAMLRSRLVRISDEGLKILAPDLAGALRPPSADAALPEDLPDDDRARLLLARASVAAWVPLVDRLTPAEIVDRVLADAAYAAELRGPGLLQARENLKKIRGLIRRMQNRGYVTLQRLVDHFASIVAGGDESNAIIDAADAVNLMTVHAAKGLEFPVVFVVNLGRGSGGTRPPIRVSAAPFDLEEEGDPIVTVGDHRSDADRDLEAREAEETKRLLYVAMTRARDRLYLCGTWASDGRFRPARGSLGRMLPASLQLILGAAASPPESPVSWIGPSGTHAIRIVEPAPPGADARVWQAERVEAVLADDLAPIPADGPVRAAVTASVEEGGEDGGPPGGGSSSVLGTLVHHLLAHAADRLPPREELERVARRILASSENIVEVEDVAGRAVTLTLGVLGRPDVQALFAGGRALFETPYSARALDGGIDRGVIDCLVVADGRATVLEFKTGAPRPGHEAQLAAYVAAARRLLPDRVVEGRLIYAAPD